jgi:LacI family gluconate utilization system Gnt-I transcriptional repressor
VTPHTDGSDPQDPAAPPQPQEAALAPSGKRRRRGAGHAAVLADVARLAGVSPMTASRALSRSAKVEPEKARRVYAAARKLAYVPNRLAGGLASSKSSMVYMVLPSWEDPVFQELMQALREALLGAGYHLFSEHDQSSQAQLLDALLGRRPDGIVLGSVVRSQALRQRIASARIPVVETGDLTANPLDMLVGFSNERVGRSVARHFAERGRRRLAFIAGDDPLSLLRRSGFAATARERGVPLDERAIAHVSPTVGGGRQGLQDLLARGVEIDAVFCGSDQIAMGVLFEAMARRIAVPQQLAVMGFGNLGASASTYPALSTVAVDAGGIGRAAAGLILERLDASKRTPEPQPPSRPHIVDVGFQIVSRDST